MDWPRIGLTVALVALVLLAVAGMWWGWRNRGRRQAAALPVPPAPPTLSEPIGDSLIGLYVSTTMAGRWQDRIVAHQMGRRAVGYIELHAEGILIERGVEDPVWIPRQALVAVATSPGTAGKVMGVPDGILLITWNWGDTAVDTGFRVDDRDGQPAWIEAAQALLDGPDIEPAAAEEVVGGADLPEETPVDEVSTGAQRDPASTEGEKSS